ncbi:5095_t:CDS:2 [Ambispora gerdemannii]|uniref:5095_t:CDS:1 n=1 Tax=Ambispora gerdemannii TaxID=144530 RepID=A0A9N8ZZB2_9GLOM|nr:5095_t:CDS:2 [Ambispora gerdemannii]
MTDSPADSKPVTIKHEVSDDEKMDSDESEEQQQQQNPSPKKRKYESRSKSTVSTTTATKPKKKEKKSATKNQTKASTTTTSNEAPPKERAKSNPWTPEEDRHLFEAVAKDVNWGEIAKEIFPDRNRQACRARWLTLIKRIERASTVVEGGAKDKISDE